MRNAFVAELLELAEAHPEVMLLTGDLGFKLFDEFAQRFPGRFINAGVAEPNMVSVAAGLAREGRRPFVYSIAPFVTIRCLEQIRDDVCYHGLPVTVVGIGGGLAYGHNGPTHHAVEDIAAMRALPGMTVVAPCDPPECRALMPKLVELGAPVYLRLGRAAERTLHTAPVNAELGRALVLRPGDDVALIACGSIAEVALQTAELLAQQEIATRVVSMHTIKPLDEEIVHRCLAETGALFTLEEHSVLGGLGGAVAEVVAEAASGKPFRRFGIPDQFTHVSGTQAYLREQFGLTPQRLAWTMHDITAQQKSSA